MLKLQGFLHKCHQIFIYKVNDMLNYCVNSNVAFTDKLNSVTLSSENDKTFDLYLYKKENIIPSNGVRS